MASYHISKSGNPGRCEATIESCPLGGAHFSNEKEAQEYVNQKAQEDHPTVPAASKKHKEAKVLYRDFIKKISKEHQLSLDLADQVVSKLISQKIGKEDSTLLIRTNPEISNETIAYVDAILRTITA